MSNIPYKTYLEESEMPKQWYNVRADMKTKPAPLLNPATLKPCTEEDLKPVFCEELIKQELNNTDAYIAIPEEIRQFYKMYRPSYRDSGRNPQFLQDVPPFSARKCLFSGEKTRYTGTYLLQI